MNQVETQAQLVALEGASEGDIYTVTSLRERDDSLLFGTTNRFRFTHQPVGNPSYLLKGVGGFWVRVRAL